MALNGAVAPGIAPDGYTGPCRRTGRRMKVFEPVQVSRNEGDQRIHLLNLSPGGALAHVTCTLSFDEPVRLLLGGTWLEAKVVWMQGARVGLRFSRPIAGDVRELFSFS